uniref:Uncharacterized protein n=1 Tax=Knipowitschia caucasica TaxID=637954 RepID=A0AAV2J2R6_KNICA
MVWWLASLSRPLAVIQRTGPWKVSLLPQTGRGRTVTVAPFLLSSFPPGTEPDTGNGPGTETFSGTEPDPRIVEPDPVPLNLLAEDEDGDFLSPSGG